MAHPEAEIPATLRRAEVVMARHGLPRAVAAIVAVEVADPTSTGAEAVMAHRALPREAVEVVDSAGVVAGAADIARRVVLRVAGAEAKATTEAEVVVAIRVVAEAAEVVAAAIITR